jgi:MFS family permease
MFKNNKPLLIVSLIAIVNAIGYGIVIPILFNYSLRFGLSVFENGLLFSLFSLCQFLSAPVIGRFSDKYGRRPLLLISLLGTVGSFLLMAFAPSAIFLFIARALDGLTAGNFPVAMAVISDTTEPKDRAKGFGMIGAAFGFGFVIGPAISALTVSLNPAYPFIIAAAITLVSAIITWIMLPETNKNIGHIHEGKMFDFPKLARAIRDENVGNTLLISLIFSLAFGLLIFAYQPFGAQILGLNLSQIALTFVAFGIVGLLAQMLIIPQVSKRVREKKILVNALVIAVIGFFAIFIARSYLFFIVASVGVSLSNAFIQPIISSLLSKEVDEKSQGEIMGINQSYASIGTIFGPIIGGVLATLSIPVPFLGGSLLCALSVWVAWRIFSKPEKAVNL